VLRLCHEFPRGRSGAGLLLLRAAIGVLMLWQAWSDFAGDLDPSPAAWILGGIALIAGALLLAGLMTPIAAAIAAVELAPAWTALHPPHAAVSQSTLLAILLMALAGAVILAGPGAFSIDARLFGLREIIVPRACSSASSPADSLRYKP